MKPANPQQTPTPRKSRPGRRGFSFTEVLFAVMILGIGFIMVAAIFPVAIQQARSTTEETTGAAVARGAANILEKAATNSAMPATGNVVVSANFDGSGPPASPSRDGFTLAEALQGSAIIGADSRYAWVPFYRRAGNPDDPLTWKSFAQVFMVPVLARNQSEFKGAPGVTDNGFGLPNIPVNLTNGLSGAPDTITFRVPRDRTVASEGAFVIIAAALTGVAGWDNNVAPQLHGRIYRLGNPVPAADPADHPAVWELMPGFDFDPIRVDADNDPATGGGPPNPNDGKETVVEGDGDLDNILVFVVGRALDPNNPGSATTPNREGTAQDIAAYTTFVNVK